MLKQTEITDIIFDKIDQGSFKGSALKLIEIRDIIYDSF